MKNSKFNSIIKFNSEYYVIFNTLTEKYFLFRDAELKDLTSVLSSSIFLDTFSEKKNIFYDKCVSNKFIIDDNEDEIADCIEKFKAYNDNSKFNITFFNNKNNSNSLTFWLDLTNKISKIVQKSSVSYKKFQLSWLYTKKYTDFKILKILTDRLYAICRENNCIYSSSLLINNVFPDNLEKILDRLSIDSVEIYLSTFNEDTAFSVAENINLLFKIKKDIKIKLIIKLYDDIVLNVHTLLQLIHYQNRDKIKLHFLNSLTFSPELFLYKMYIKSINLGYRYSYLDTAPSFISSLTKNSLCIDSELNISSCIVAANANDYFAKLDDNGSINIFNNSLYCQYLDQSIIDNYRCACCPELPICPANYPYYRSRSRFLCIRDLYNDLTLEQKIKLKVLNDVVLTKTLPKLL